MINSQHIHFIGIGGIGISALAYLALKEGKNVGGSDINGSELIDNLRRDGARIQIGHNANNINEETQVVVYSEAIDFENNPEYKRAKELKIPTLSYFGALGQLSYTKDTIIVAGTHGKSTTTAMLGLALIDAGLNPTVIVGSKVREFGNRNIHIGKGDMLLIEACEYRRSFLSLRANTVVLLNCEVDHLDYYKDEADYLSAFEALIDKIPSNGVLIANMEDKNVVNLTKYHAGELIEVRNSDLIKIKLNLQVIGNFNKMNALHAYKAAIKLGAEEKDVVDSLENFKGTWRRMESKGFFKESLVIDDYGHHPTEAKVTLQAIKEEYPNKNLICVFQAHQYSRTHKLINQFKKAFLYADKLIISNIYESRDNKDDKNKINVEKFVNILKQNHKNVVLAGNIENSYEILQKTSGSKNDIIVTMGAGNITELANMLVNK